MNHTGKKFSLGTAALLIVLAAYLCAICMINFSDIPSFYDTDMYADIYYAMKVWKSKSIFPENWVFGNQLNAVSAPVLASLFYGLTADPVLSMAIAATVMSLFVILSFDWMLKPVFKSLNSRLSAVVVLMALVLFCGKAIEGNIGWSMLFTMCSYYSGYTIAAFLAFGAYLRPDLLSDWKRAALFAVICAMSFGMGIQSIRQTVVMVAPLVAVEGLAMLTRVCREGWRKCLNKNSLIIVGGITVSNLLGLIFVRLIEINQVEILGSIELNRLSELPGQIKQALITFCALLLNESLDSLAIMGCIGILCILSAIWIVKRFLESKNQKGMILLLLLSFSVLVIAVIDVMTAMLFASRYYFMVFPLIAYLAADYVEFGKKPVKAIVMSAIVLLAVFAGVKELAAPCKQIFSGEPDPYTEVGAYLVDQGYPIVFTEWDHGEKAAIAADGKVTASFWLDQDRPFVPVEYLSDPAIVSGKPEDCVYLFEGERAVDFAMEAAQSKGVTLELLHHFEDSDIYLYTAPVNLMLLFQ